MKKTLAFIEERLTLRRKTASMWGGLEAIDMPPEDDPSFYIKWDDQKGDHLDRMVVEEIELYVGPETR